MCETLCASVGTVSATKPRLHPSSNNRATTMRSWSAGTSVVHTIESARERRGADPADAYDAHLQRLSIAASEQVRMPFVTVITNGDVAALDLPADATRDPPPSADHHAAAGA